MAAVNAPLGQLVELIGMPAALRLVDHFGGLCIYLPHPSRVKEHSEVALAIGPEAMCKLAEVWPQSHVIVPRPRRHFWRQRAAVILRDAATLSVRELARKYEMTERNVYYVLAHPELGEAAAGAPKTQGSLFD